LGIFTQYKKLFELSIYNEFYNGYNAIDLKFELDASSRLAIDAFSLIIKETSSGIVILYPEAKESLMQEMNTEFIIRFHLVSKNPHFFNFTELDHDLDNERYYLSTRSSKIREDNSDEMLLHDTDYLNRTNIAYVADSKTDIFKLSGENSLRIFNSNEEEISAESTNADGELGSLLGQEYGTYTVVSSNLPEGKKLIYLEYIKPRSFGVTEFVLNKNYLANHSLEVERKFTIKLKNRSVFWRYYFIEQNERIPGYIDFTEGRSKLEISDPSPVTLINNKQGALVSILKPKPLQYKYKDLKLLATINENSTKTNAKSIKLPTPSPERLKAFYHQNTQVYYAEMYINYKLKT
jgi:hypothetical protein